MEDAVHTHFKGVNEQYLGQVKSLSFNLKDPNNPDFVSRIVSGDIATSEVATLTSSQMAAKKKEEEVQKAIKDKAFQMETFKINEMREATDMFECGKCKKRKTTFYQKQTRSADEPMTIFITCLNCGHEWRD
mmetsp:Transcript_84593/g.225942  ORF Transcript_84593/g.225942 Transcript_84593/m.225942 type:complete len:132 (-) Transcript_84593:47-442(-)